MSHYHSLEKHTIDSARFCLESAAIPGNAIGDNSETINWFYGGLHGGY